MYPGTMNNEQKWDVGLLYKGHIYTTNYFDLQEQNFDILTGYDNEPIIAFHLSNPICEDGSESQNLAIKTDVSGIEILNGLCRQVRNFCRILYSWLLTTWDEFQ